VFQSDAIDHEIAAALDYAKLEGMNLALLQQEGPAILATVLLSLRMAKGLFRSNHCDTDEKGLRR
jgi:hypothetical protein